MLQHPNAISILDVGFHRDELYAVLEQPTGTVDLESLTLEIGGAMPGFLAAEYARAVASVLRLVHQLGGVHGDVRPANLLVGPLTLKTGPDGVERRRPAPDAVIRLAEVGLVPPRPPAAQFLTPGAALPYLPPERIDGAVFEPLGDIYGLGSNALLPADRTAASCRGGPDATSGTNPFRDADTAWKIAARPAARTHRPRFPNDGEVSRAPARLRV